MKEGCYACLIGMVFLTSFIFIDKTLPIERNTTKVISIQHKGQTFEVKLRESFILVLPNPGAGGYVLKDPEIDSQILTLMKMEKKPASEPNKVGDFGSFEWTFLPKEKGVSPIIVRAFRPWEREKAPIVLFEATVQVNQ